MVTADSGSQDTKQPHDLKFDSGTFLLYCMCVKSYRFGGSPYDGDLMSYGYANSQVSCDDLILDVFRLARVLFSMDVILEAQVQ